MSEARRCGGITRSGRACRAWALRGLNPPRCRAHQNNEETTVRPAIPPGADYHQQTGRAVVVLPGRSSTADLQDEIQNVRVVLAHLLEKAEAAPDMGDRLTEFAHLIFDGTRTLSRLLRDQHAISSDDDGEMQAILRQALAELGAELDLDL